MIGLSVKKTIFPKEQVKDFNDWMTYIKSQIDKNKNVKNK